ncbi:MAG: hypothetical protein GY869_20310, partial [Planctomycetes bacterium]|nr:hypothetical protein [Planctomycetota bacterium]
MRKLAHLAVILFCVGLGLFVVTVTAALMSGSELSQVQQDQMMRGQIESWILSGAIWSWCPKAASMQLLKRLYSTPALLMTVPLFIGLYYTQRIKGKRSLLTVGLMCLAVGALPYMCGRLALWYNSDLANI